MKTLSLITPERLMNLGKIYSITNQSEQYWHFKKDLTFMCNSLYKVVSKNNFYFLSHTI